MQRVSGTQLLVALFALLSIAAYMLFLLVAVNQLLDHEKVVFDGRLLATQLYAAGTAGSVSSMAAQLAVSIDRAEAGLLQSPVSEKLRPRGDTGMYDFDSVGFAGLQGVYDESVLNDRLIAELTAATAVEAFMANMAGSGQAYVWAYYLSNYRFLIIAPPSPLLEPEEFSELYSLPFWTQLGPDSNPGRELMVTDVYSDQGGQGLMITVAHPVYTGEAYRGVFCLDLTLENLQTALDIGHAMGRSVVVDERGGIVVSPIDISEAKASLFSIHNSLVSPNFTRIGGEYIITGDILSGQLRAIHKVDVSLIFSRAFLAEIPIFMALMVLNLLLILSFHLRKSFKKASAETEFSRRLLSIIGHDLQTPLSVINQAIDIVDPSDENTARDLVKRSTASAINLLKDLSYWGKSRFQDLTPETTSCFVPDLVERCLEAVRPAADWKEIRLQTQLQVPVVLADPGILSTVLRNLLSNAVKFSPRASVVSLNVAAAEDGRSDFCVTDQGMGMSETQVELFMKGQPLESRVGSCGEKGSGIGLGIVRNLCDKAGWPLKLESQVNKKTQFTFSVPVPD